MSNIRKAVTSLTLDLSMPDVQAGFTCTLGDRARRLEILVTDGGRPYDIPPTWSAFLSGVKPDQTELVNGCVVEGGRLTYDFESGEQIATCAGAFPVTVWIMDENGTPVASPKIWVNVIDSGVQAIMNNNSSEDQFGVLQEIVGTFNALIEKDAQVDSDIRNLIRREEIVIPSSTWKDETPLEYSNRVMVPIPGVKTILLYPADDESKAEATRVRLSAEVKSETLVGYDATYTVFRSSGTKAPEIDIKLVAISMTPKEEVAFGTSRVIMVGFDTTAEDIDASIKQAADEIEQAKQDIEQAKQDIEQAKQDIEDTITVSSVTVAKDSFRSNVSILEAPAVDKGDVLIVMPGDETTRNEMSLHRITVDVKPGIGEDRVIIRKKDDEALENDLNLTVIRLKDNAQSDPKVVLIGVNTTADDIDESIKEAKNEIASAKKDISAAKISIEIAKDNIAEAKQDIDQAKQDIDQAKRDIEETISISITEIPASRWRDSDPYEATLNMGSISTGEIILLIPGNSETKEASEKARLTVTPETGGEDNRYVYVARSEASKPPMVKLVFIAIRLKDESTTDPRVALIGVDSYSDSITSSIDLSRMDEGEIVETFVGGITKTTTIEHDADGNPVKITDGDGNVTVLTW